MIRSMNRVDQKETSRLDAAFAFTETFRRFEHEHVAIREAMCLKAQFPAILEDIGENDLFAGRCRYLFVGFKHGTSPYEMGYYCREDLIAGDVDRKTLSPEDAEKLNRILDFWKGRTTVDVFKSLSSDEIPDRIKTAFLEEGKSWRSESFAAAYMFRMCEINLDFEKLLSLGISGIRTRIIARRQRSKDDGEIKLFDGMLVCLDVFTECCRYYAVQARTKAGQTNDDKRKQELREMADILEKITLEKPATLREAMQLFWLYSVIAGLDNYGRMDVYLGDFYAQDVDGNRLTEPDALNMVQRLWEQIASLYPISGRVIIGGRGRPNKKNADRFALCAIEATRITPTDSPTLSLRIHEGMDQNVYAQALNCISSGRTYPLLYNDDVNIPGLAEAFGVPDEEAAQYVMSNCGEYALDHRSISSPNGSINYFKLLELTLNNGIDPISNKPMGIASGDAAEYDSYESLWEAYVRQIETIVRATAENMANIYRAAERAAPNLFASMLFDDCVERGKGLVSGARYAGFDLETHGIISVSDSLAAIKKNVFEDKIIPFPKLVTILRKNFEGYDNERRMLMQSPKFGNDDDYADSIAVNVFNTINNITDVQKRRHGLHYSLASHVSVNANVYSGRFVGASADGRKAGTPMSNSLNPLAGNDRNGLTALLNSMRKFKPAKAAGQICHLKLTHELMTKYRTATEALIRTFFVQGGSYLCISVMNKNDLEQAIKYPERNANLMVRVGGFSAHFVTLPREMQEEIISRTMY